MKIEVSDGDIVDRVAILKVKLDRIEDPEKQANIQAEYDYLSRCMLELGVDHDSEVFQSLYALHATSWELIETWNRKDAAGEYDAEYIDVTRRANRCNRDRFHLKAALNRHSHFVEEKSDIYGKYARPAESSDE